MSPACAVNIAKVHVGASIAMIGAQTHEVAGVQQIPATCFDNGVTILHLQRPTRLTNWTYSCYFGNKLGTAKNKRVGKARTSSRPTRSTLELTLSELSGRVALAMAAARVQRPSRSCYRGSHPCRDRMKQ